MNDWYGYLLLAEFAYNNGNEEPIKSTQFFPQCGMNLEYEITRDLFQEKQQKPEEMTQLDQSLRSKVGAGEI